MGVCAAGWAIALVRRAGCGSSFEHSCPRIRRGLCVYHFSRYGRGGKQRLLQTAFFCPRHAVLLAAYFVRCLYGIVSAFHQTALLGENAARS